MCISLYVFTAGHSHPGNTYSGVAELSDMRMYLHDGLGGGQGPVAAHELLALAKASAVGVQSDHRCVAKNSPKFADTEWRDAFGLHCVCIML